jgi:ABC-type multidrug transport system ATPase subunit
MLELREVTVEIGREAAALLRGASMRVEPGHFVAIVGPSGCGKSTLLKTIAGLVEPSEGAVCWEGRDLAEEDLHPADIGYVPQFSIANDYLTVRESVDGAIRLRVGDLGGAEREERLGAILAEVGLGAIADRQVRVLSGGQKRRLALAMEMASKPVLMLCDEVTSGLDPKAEKEIVGLMHRIAREDGRTVLSVTHSLRHLDRYDAVLVMHEGVVAFYGAPSHLLHYFDVESPEEIFPRLAKRKAEEWGASWRKHGEAFAAEPGEKDAAGGGGEKRGAAEGRERVRTAGAWAQFLVLLERRWKVFGRNRGQLALQLALVLGFPCLVVIFALGGLPAVPSPASDPTLNPLQQAEQARAYAREASHVGGLVSGLAMFQVILMTLVGSNNAAREIAAERPAFEKEKLSGLRPGSYVASKAVFLGGCVAVQSAWMAFFVDVVCGLPGDFASQFAFLALANAAMTSVCLGISGMSGSAEQASLASIYLVGFQLPLSGAVLALPAWMEGVARPFVVAYWSWSGFLQAFRDTRYYEAVMTVSQTALSHPVLCAWVLGCHAVVGLFLAWIGCRRGRWV